MATLKSFLKNLFPFKGYKFFVLESNDRVLITMKSRRKTGQCPKCGKHCKHIETEYKRIIRDLDMSGKKCFLQFKQKKIHCHCDYRGFEKLDFADKLRRVTKRMENYVVSLCEKMSIKDVSLVTHLDWKTIKVIDRDYIKSTLPDVLKLNIRKIAIDEIAIMKGHKYFTIIRDYDTGLALAIIFGRGYEETAAGLSKLGKEKLALIEFASMDMWDPYIKTVKEKCPNAKIVFDKFHIVKKINEALDKIRKKEFAKADKEERINMKHKRFIILKKEKNLKKKEKEELKKLMKTNNKLYKAYLLKEQIISVFDDKKSTFEQIKERISQWFENIQTNKIKEFYGVIKTMQSHLDGILNYFRYEITNAIAEGFNTKINVIKRRAYGFSDLEYFMLKIYQSSIRRLS